MEKDESIPASPKVLQKMCVVKCWLGIITALFVAVTTTLWIGYATFDMSITMHTYSVIDVDLEPDICTSSCRGSYSSACDHYFCVHRKVEVEW